MTETAPDLPEVVGWCTVADVEQDWPDSQRMDPATLVRVLRVAHETCAAFAPAIEPNEDGTPGEVPERYRTAQMLQAKAVWAMARQDGGERFQDGYSVAVYPLDARIRQLLRPKTMFGGLL